MHQEVLHRDVPLLGGPHFTVLPDGPIAPEDLLPPLERVLARVAQESGIDFAVQAPMLRERRPGSVEGRVYYKGPRGAYMPARVKLDLTSDEVVVRPPVLRPIAHPYSDEFPTDATVRCYSFEELLGEKIRAMGQRGQPRDLYDIVTLFWRQDLQLHPDLIREVVEEKCRVKGVAVPSHASILASGSIVELRSEWENMLGHQLPALPSVDQFLEEIPRLFEWLDGTLVVPVLEAMAGGADEDMSWSPPPTVASWGQAIPLETVRFAAANRLCVELDYQGTTRVIEPYSLRQTRAGNLVLHALRAPTREHRSYRVDRIQGVRVTTTPFVPAWAIEFSSRGPLAAPPAHRSPSFRRSSTGPRYVVECLVCGKLFYRKKRSTVLKPHKAPDGWNCSGRRGNVVDRR